MFSKKIDSTKLIKNAGASGLVPIVNQQSEKNKYEMLFEMLRLPKYDQIKSELEHSRGVVNFVTQEGWEPLVDALLKTVFAIGKNDIYAPHADMSKQPEYSIDAKNYFGHKPNETDETRYAANRLIDLLHGTVKRETMSSRKDLYEITGADEATTDAALWIRLHEEKGETPPAASFEQWIHPPRGRNGEAVAPGNPDRPPQGNTAIPLYWKLYRQRALIEKLLVDKPSDPTDPRTSGKDLRSVKTKLIDIRGQIDAINNPSQDPNEAVSREEMVSHRSTLPQLEAKYDSLRKQYLDIQAALNSPEFDDLILVDHQGVPERNNDGFMGFDPYSDIDSAYKNILSGTMMTKKMETGAKKASDKQQEPLKHAVELFRGKIRDFKTTDKILKGHQDNLIAFLGSDEKEAYIKYIRNVYTFKNLYAKFSNRASSHGKSLIITDFEYSPFCVMPMGDPSPEREYEFGDGGIIDGFMGQNNLDHITGTDRRLILVSKHPIKKMGCNTIIKMDATYVDREEAKIILKHRIDFVCKNIHSIESSRRQAKIDEEFEGQEFTDDVKKQKKAKIDIANAELKAIKSKRERIDPSVLNRMIRYLIGMSQAKAIDAVSDALDRTLEVIRDEEDSSVASINLDYSKMVTKIRDAIESRQEFYGIGTHDINVKFGNYAYNKMKSWGRTVPVIGHTYDKIKTIRDQVDDYSIRIRDNEEKIKKTNNPVEIAELEKFNAKYATEIRRLNVQEGPLIRGIPHMFLLYGDPGVGKSVWAEALADLLNHESIKTVDIGGQREKWVGQSGRNTVKMFQYILRAKDQVFLFDEIDKQVQSDDKGGGDNTGTHQEQISLMLEFFEKPANIEYMIQNDVFIILTTNYCDRVQKALQSRLQQAKYWVELPDKPEDYLMLLKGYMDNDRKSHPNNPPFCLEGEETTQQCWDNAEAFFKSVDFQAIAEALAVKKIDFRAVKLLIGTLMAEHARFKSSLTYCVDQNGVFYPDKITGAPLTAENAVRYINNIKISEHSVKMTDKDSESHIIREFSLDSAQNDLTTKIKSQQKLMADRLSAGQIKLNKTINPLNGFVSYTVEIPSDVMEYMNGKNTLGDPPVDPEHDYNNMEVETIEKLDANGNPIKVKQFKPSSDKEIDQDLDALNAKGLEPSTISPEEAEKVPVEEDEVPAKDKKDNKKKKEDVESSTDYYYNHLKKQGIIREAQELKDKGKKNENVIDALPPPKGCMAGIYNFRSGLLIAPKTENTPLQYIIDRNTGKRSQ